MLGNNVKIKDLREISNLFGWEIVRLSKECLMLRQSKYIRNVESIGCILYLATCTRPEIAFTVGKLSNGSSVADWKGVKDIMRYLISTQNRKMTYRRDKPIVKVFCDADCANDRDVKS
ncbi:hypothetical protein PR048_010907, partial [Dryococelus australis]